MATAEQLVRYGFIKDGSKAKYLKALSKGKGEFSKLIRGLKDKSPDDFEKDADMEEVETFRDSVEKTGFPTPQFRHHLIFQSSNAFIEETYFWIMNALRQYHSYTEFHKISDVFAASEQSSFFGVSEQRLGLQQDKAAQYLKGISEMIKALFQIVREIRIIDERLAYYENTYKDEGEESEGSEITLKGIWIDQVEGGVKNAASVYGLAQTVGFTILPDLFFRVRADDKGMDKLVTKEEFEKKLKDVLVSINKNVDSLKEFNEKVREVLKRKLTQYYTWKTRTYQELRTRKRFTVKYLRQHYDVIKLYMGWIKPYLRNVKRMHLDEKKQLSYELISAFEGAMLEIEILATKPGKGKFQPCILNQFVFRSMPAMQYVQEGYQRGPTHVGRLDWTMRAYVWTTDQIKSYLKMKEEEDLELLGSINASIQEAMDALGENLWDYLEGEGEKVKKPPEFEKKKEEAKKQSAAEPFTALWDGFKELFGSLAKMPELKGFSLKAGSAEENYETAEAFGGVKSNLKFDCWLVYKNYKKSHKLLTW